MAVKNPYIPPNYGMVSTAIERRIAGKPPASLREEEEEVVEEKSEAGAPVNKDAGSAPTNKAVSVSAKKAPIKRKAK